MKLTKTMRENFVLLAMQDVPRTDYRTQAQDLINRASIAALPPAVQAAYSTHPEYIVENSHYYQGWGYISFVGIGAAIPAVNAEVTALSAADDAEIEARLALRDKLMGVAMSVTSVEKLIELMPEFEKYVTPKPIDTKNLPAISNLVADFMAAGWPVGKAVAA